MCCRSTTVKRLVPTSASSRVSVMTRLPWPLMSATATLWYGAMLISAGLITGTRTATVPQAQSSAALSATTWFFMVDVPGLPDDFPQWIGSIAVEAGSTSLSTGQPWPLAVDPPSLVRRKERGGPRAYAQFHYLCRRFRSGQRCVRASSADARHRRSELARERRLRQRLRHGRRAHRGAGGGRAGAGRRAAAGRH